MAFATGTVDKLSDPEDIKWLLDEKQSGLRVNELLLREIEVYFGHVSFVMAKDMTYFSEFLMPLIKDSV